MAKLLAALILNDKNAEDYERTAMINLFTELKERAENANKFSLSTKLAEFAKNIFRIKDNGEER